MYLMYMLDENGDRVYTFRKLDNDGKPTLSAHPARFSPEDKYSKHRVAIKRRFNLLPIQQPPIKY
ncbi:H/ACA ribonucleoprotein complex subunit 3 [Hetaerina americana]|uniref:H/ACA ribonucleoprotein complex subunit 3 n=1 Tax=Hetaerina americana TaxID=62018 RepID=UPI003A7F2701